MTATRKAITNFLTSTSKVAHALDWRKASGAVLSLRVLQDRIDLAVASHPSFEEPTHTLPSIPLQMETKNNRKVLKESVKQELKDILDNFNVCGMVVSWPVQKEGRLGASCGRTLHALDQITETVIDGKRPVCLYDPEHYFPPEDEWGRAALYSHASNKTVHIASKEQYQDATGKVAADIWNDFCKEHWPEFCNATEQYGKINQNSSSYYYQQDKHNSDNVEYEFESQSNDWEDDDNTYTQVAL